MTIDSADLIRKLPMMIQGNKTFAKFSEGGDYHIGEVDSWCLNYKEIVEGIESYCEYKRTNQYKLGAPVNGSFALNSYDYDEPQTDYTPDCPFCTRYGTEDCLGSDCSHYKTYKDEPLSGLEEVKDEQTDCQWK